MNNSSENLKLSTFKTLSKVSVILFNDVKNKDFIHTKTFEKLLEADNIKAFPKNGEIYRTSKLLLDSLAAKSISIPVSLNDNTQVIDCTHLIRIPEFVRRNVFFDLTYSENIVGSFTVSLEDIQNLDQLNTQFFEALHIHRSPQKWIESAELNMSSFAKLEITDPSVSDFNLHYLRCISETYGLQALTDCQSKIIKWIEDHRWRYID
jgi:hypothetical protein